MARLPDDVDWTGVECATRSGSRLAPSGPSGCAWCCTWSTSSSTRGTPRAPDWPQILALYGLLERMTGNPMVMLNRAVAGAMVDGPAGLALLARLDGRLAGHHRLDAVRAHLLDMAGDVDGAIAHYRTAAGRTTSLVERTYLDGGRPPRRPPRVMAARR